MNSFLFQRTWTIGFRWFACHSPAVHPIRGSESLAELWLAQDSRLRFPEGSAAGFERRVAPCLVKVWDIGGLVADGSLAGPPPLLDRIPADFPTDAAWLSSDRLAMFLSEGPQYLNVSLSARNLTTGAAQRLTRSFSVEECAVYQIDLCPTLEQVRSR